MKHPDRALTETSSDPDEGFLRRWSRRKQAARTTAPADAPASGADAVAPAVPDAHAGDADTTGAHPPADADRLPPGDEDMPPLDSLGPDSNVSMFFSPRVSEALRRAALRRIFHQPAFNVTDGLDDYCADYRHMVPLGAVVTADMRLKAERLKGRVERVADGVRTLTREVTGPDTQHATAATEDREEPHGDA